MAVASTPTLIPLDRAAEILGISSLYFNGVISDYWDLDPDCDGVWYQYAWQRKDRFSREEFAENLAVAENTVARYLGYYPLPTWIRNEEHLLSQPRSPEQYSFYNTRGMRKSVLTRWGFVQDTGVRATSLIEAGSAITYDDPYSTGYDQRATVSVATTLTDIEEVHVFYPGEDTVEWEIRPVEVSIAGGIATITFKREQAVLPELLNRVPAPGDPLEGVDGDDDANFLTTVDVYRVYTDPSQQAVFYQEPSCSGCDLTEYTGCVYIRDSRRGFLAYEFATWDEDTETYTYTTPTGIPLRGVFYYKAGLRNENSLYPNLRMKPDLERLIVYYALTLSDKEICGCDNFSSAIAHQLEDVAEGNKYKVVYEQLYNPLGTKRASIAMWNYIQNNKLGYSLRKG